MSNEDAIQAIKSRIRLSDLARRYVDLRHAGARLVAPCPFHQETKPSFSINDEQGLFYCFGCQASGDIFDFYGRINGLDFRETLHALAEEAGVRLEDRPADPRQKRERSKKLDMMRMHELAAAHFRSNLASPQARACREYADSRGISPELRERFGIGWSMDGWQDLCGALARGGFDTAAAVECGLLSRSQSGRVFDRFRSRLMFPIRSLSGQAVAFGGRILPALAKEDDAKYINSSDSPIYRKGEHLYGLFQARPSIAAQKAIMLTEGYMDVITLHQYGYTQAAGILGTSLTPDQVKRISGLCSHVELMLDGDEPGMKAAQRSCEMLLARGLSCKVVLFPGGNDVDSMLHSYGRDAVEELRAHAADGLDYCISRLRSMAPRDAVEWARSFLSQVELPELFHRYAARLSAGLGISESTFREGVLDRRRTSPARHDAPSAPKHPRAGSIDREIMTFAVRHPRRVKDLQDAGADLVLSAPWAIRLWGKLSALGAGAFDHLDEKEKSFWTRCQSGDAPPLDNEAAEFDAISILLENHRKDAFASSVQAALQQNGGTASQREYLIALKEAQGRHRDQQS
ncbi:MAG: DNA primase [Desulfovibrio sp.]|jgi:DNA primase|nr:DNA primase [Mailhella sp.]